MAQLHDHHQPPTHVHHAVEVISSHRTSEGIVRYLRCACGAVVLETATGRHHMGAPAAARGLSDAAA